MQTNQFKTATVTAALTETANTERAHSIKYIHKTIHHPHPTTTTHTASHTCTHSDTVHTQTAPRRVPLQLPPLYYWSIWRLLSQGWHGLGDVTAQPINTTLKALDPALVWWLRCACVHACVRVCVCVWAVESCSSCDWTLPSWPVYRTVITWEETLVRLLLTGPANEVKHRQIGKDRGPDMRAGKKKGRWIHK